MTAKRWRRFRSFRRAWVSFWILLVLYALSLCSELLCNSRPLLVWSGRRLYAPFCQHVPASAFLAGGGDLAPDYRQLAVSEAFQANGGWMLWPLFRYDPNEAVPSAELDAYCRVAVLLTPVPGVGTAVLTTADGAWQSFAGVETLLPSDTETTSASRLSDYWELPTALQQALAERFANRAAPACEETCRGRDGAAEVTMFLPAFKPRRQPPKRVSVKVSERLAAAAAVPLRMRFDRGGAEPAAGTAAFRRLPAETQKLLAAAVAQAFRETTGADADSGRQFCETTAADGGPQTVRLDGRPYTLTCARERVEHPFRPVPGHWFGLDDAGRDVLARILYGLRTSLTFGLILVASSMLFGTLFGCLQGYLGGKVDLLGQRAIEIWSALPFLYIVILMGSLFGTGFWLLIVCYALFNWIGVSYYMRAEMLRLRRQPFVEAARCLGLPWWLIVSRHILPNALVPLVTFIPFSLVGAIGALAGLDYLGFGLPPPTPSLGQLLQQAQVQREAWWLIVYPSLALFVVMLLCVFVGEGVREAFDPKRQNRLS